MLSYKPSLFFSELNKQTGSPTKSLQNMISRGIREGYIIRDIGVPILTKKGERRLEVIREGVQMEEGNYYIVVYDIPQSKDYQRRQLSYELKALGFKQYQKSFWISDYNYEHSVLDIAKELHVAQYITAGTFAKTFGYELH
jgi:DNA-binding transcriptional regulator PaaX